MTAFQYSATHPHLKLLEDNWQIIRDEYLAAANMVTEWPETYLHNGLWDVLGIHYPDHQMPGESLCPPEAWLEVLGERHVAQDGKVAVFDDRNQHSAGNQGESERVVLIVDFWKTAA
ncbi:aspartyl/asparaginyl beta-hydroxylase domain-containing protein [Herbaspirillum sp. NPDC087042]|uniref:aspartyl/asparaginyl beta-hydroxylase domain-containing protein n=1 Tax=Herbaspirillum sp. NPDC087042 TaxID=3364004 RepID=UPI00382DDD4F